MIYEWLALLVMYALIIYLSFFFSFFLFSGLLYNLLLQCFIFILWVMEHEWICKEDFQNFSLIMLADFFNSQTHVLLLRPTIKLWFYYIEKWLSLNLHFLVMLVYAAWICFYVFLCRKKLCCAILCCRSSKWQMTYSIYWIQ